MNPVIFTCYNQVIEPKMINLQRQVVDKFRGTIPYRELIYNFDMTLFDHGDILNRALTHIFYHSAHDCVLIIDVDAIPLSSRALDITFDLAYQGHVVGNIQRSNHCENDQHVYVASSYACFTRETYEYCGNPNLSYTNKYDTLEMLTVNAERFNRPVTMFMPYHVTCPTDTGEYWPLKDGMPVYGMGTTFSYRNEPLTFHLFGSAHQKWNQIFYDKCKSILT
jgi:hypothetical protein